MLSTRGGRSPADAHGRGGQPTLAIRPGTDPFLLMAPVNVLAADGLVDTGPAVEHLRGVEEVLALAEPFTPEAVAEVTVLGPPVIRGLAHDLAAAPTACVHGPAGRRPTGRPLSGNAVLDGIPVEVAPVPAAAPA